MNRNSIVVDAIRNDARMCVHSKSWEDNAVEQRMKDSDQPGELGRVRCPSESVGRVCLGWRHTHRTGEAVSEGLEGLSEASNGRELARRGIRELNQPLHREAGEVKEARFN